ncbi:hypothetical protein EBU71_16305, partial [bacterium]|nr:hypothetical protein [Candidatus Elulimicrobium humile]
MATTPDTAFFGSIVTVSYSEGSSVYNLRTVNSPGSIPIGTFPNSLNPYSISTSTVVSILPFRGGKNFKAQISPINQAGRIGVTTVGPQIYSYVSEKIHNYNTLIWNLNEYVVNLNSSDQYGGYVDSSGSYHYLSSKFLKTRAWLGVYQYRNGYRQRSIDPNAPIGHSLL